MQVLKVRSGMCLWKDMSAQDYVVLLAQPIKGSCEISYSLYRSLRMYFGLRLQLTSTAICRKDACDTGTQSWVADVTGAMVLTLMDAA